MIIHWTSIHCDYCAMSVIDLGRMSTQEAIKHAKGAGWTYSKKNGLKCLKCQKEEQIIKE